MITTKENLKLRALHKLAKTSKYLIGVTWSGKRIGLNGGLAKIAMKRESINPQNLNFG